ncbi:serine hydrolase [Streptomyces racemochromogenes]|uniref:Serine hydrolase n=1 Tax=Streptomyces racemochromogenes TaxID=67353 RepID=A0ABW7PG39_9ACTN
MKAETVAGGGTGGSLEPEGSAGPQDGSPQDGPTAARTRALAGREEGGAPAGRERPEAGAAADGRVPAGSEARAAARPSEEDTASRRPPAASAPDTPTTTRPNPAAPRGPVTPDGTSPAEPRPTEADPAGADREGADPAGADATDEDPARTAPAGAGTPAEGARTSLDAAPDRESPAERPEPAVVEALGELPRPSRAGTPGREGSGAEPVGAEPAGAGTRPQAPVAGAPAAGPEPVETDTAAGDVRAGTPEPRAKDPRSALVDVPDREASAEPESGDTDSDGADTPAQDSGTRRAPAPGTRTEAEPTGTNPDRADTPNDGSDSGRTSAPGSRTPTEAEPADTNADRADAREDGSDSGRTGASETGTAAGPESAEAEADAPVGGSAAADERRPARGGDSGRGTAAEAGSVDADASGDAAPARDGDGAAEGDGSRQGNPGEPGSAAGEAASKDGAGTARTAPVRRPSWAKRDDGPDRDDDTRELPAGAVPADVERAATTRRPSWAKADDAPEGDGDTAGADAPRTGDRRPSGTPAGDGRQADGKAPGGPAPEERRDREGGTEAARTAGQPTGTGAAAPAQPHDPERTSEFVALKDPDAAPPKPAPKAPVAPVLEPTRETPRPPLELLAELTNTAPPPETPRRTLVRRVKVWTPIALLLGAVVAGGQLLRPLPAPQLVAAQDALTLDGTTTLPWPAKGQAAVRVPGSGDIGTFGEQKPVPTASVAKVMTAYVILKGHPLRKNDPGPAIEIDAQAAAEGKSGDESRIRTLTAGKKFSQQDMLKMMMIPSANNIARLLARWDSGSEAAFVAKMNAAARELGMRDTTYTDPSGLNASTVSTAADQLKLAEAVMQDEAFRAIVAIPDTRIEGLPEPIVNNNSLLSAPGLSNKGIKTGSSTPAGGTLMWAAYKTVGGETPLILGTMMDQHAPPPDKDAADSLALVLENSRKVIEAVRTALAAAPVIHKGQTVGYVSDGLGGRTPLVATKDLSVIGVPGQKLRLALGTAGGKVVPHTATSGTEVGVLTVGEGAGAKTVPVAVGTNLREPSFGTRVTRLS